MTNSLAVEVEGLTKVFGTKEVLKRSSLSVEKGSIYGFLGKNGAGKTTVFKVLSGLLVPTMGKVTVLGRNIQTERESVLKDIGTLIETPVFYEHLSATDNLKIHLDYMGVEGESIPPVLNRVGLEETGTLPVSKFSLGMRQRLAIARAISHRPQLLILDEPTNGLDPIGIREMRTLFTTLVKEEGMTILLSSHILSEIEPIADKLGIIDHGVILKEESMERIRKDYPSKLEEYFFEVIRREETA